MRSPVRALIWEQWRQVWWTAPLGIGLTWAVSLALHQDAEIEAYKDIWRMGSTAAIIGSLALAGGLLLFVHSSPTNIRPGLPARHLTLPVSSTALALTQFAFRFGYFSTLALVLITVVVSIDGSYMDALIPATAFTACSFAVILACMWTVGRWNVFAAGAASVGIIVSLFFLQEAIVTRWPEAAPVLPTLVVVACAIVSTRAVARRQIRARGLPPQTKGPSHAPTRTVPFGGPVQAYQWFESRRKVGVLTASAAVFLGYLCALLGYELCLHALNRSLAPTSANALANNLDIFALAFALAPPVVAFMAGLCIALLDYRDGTLRLAHFVFTHPMRTQDIVRARYWFGAKAAFALCTPCFAMSACLAFWCLRVNTMAHYVPARFYPSSEYLLVLAVSMIATWGLLWSPAPPLAAILALGAITYIIETAGVVVTRDYLHVLLWVVPAALAAVTCYRAYRAHQSMQLDIRSLKRPLWILLLLATVLAAVLASSHNLWYENELTLATAHALAIALYAVVSQPIWIEHLRHGGANRTARRPLVEV